MKYDYHLPNDDGHFFQYIFYFINIMHFYLTYFSSECDFKHLSEVLTSLTQLNAQAWGEMGSRMIGLLISDFSSTFGQLTTGLNEGAFGAAGAAAGKLFSLSLDATL